MLGIAPHLFSSFVRVFAALPDFGLGSQSSPSRPFALWRSAVVRQLPPIGRGSPARSEQLLLLSSCFVLLCLHGTSSDYDAYQVIGRYRWAIRGGLTQRGSDRRKSNQSNKGASSEKRQ